MATPNDPVTPQQGANPTTEPTWDQRILAVLPSSVDLGQIRENLRLTPTERVEQMLGLVAFVEAQRERTRVRATSSR